MGERSWTDRIVGERMRVDQEFSSRIAESRFSNQEWSLIMTATDFEIENPEDPETAQIVANTENVEHVLPELENLRSQMGQLGGGVGSGRSNRQSGSVVGSIKRVLGLGNGGSGSGAVSDAEREAAERLTQEYANELQSHLESSGRWDAVRRQAAEK